MAAQAITAQDIHALTGRIYPRLASGVPPLLALLRRLVSRYEQHRRYRETVTELGRLNDHLLADIGIGRHQISDMARALSRHTA